MSRFIPILLIPVLFAACQTEISTKKDNSTPITEMSSWQAYFDSYRVHGCMVIKKINGTEQIWVYNPARIDSMYMPASTFKIANSLIALETGVVKGTDQVFEWDGEERFYDDWNQDLNIKQAFRYSAVWVYQEIARRIGEKRMQLWVDSLNYGNKNISGGIDRFWLDGDLRISANQQIDFIERLALNQLPFSENTMLLMDSIMIREQTDGYTLRAKTGWAIRVDNQMGWYVGWLEEDGDQYVFAMNVDIHSDEDAKSREGITIDIFKSMGLMKED